MKRIGLLGGSFNPAHLGHRKLSLHAIRALGLDEVWWLVSPGNPLKDKAGMAPFKARMASARPQAAPAVPAAPLHLADGRGQSRPVPQMGALARHCRAGSDCGDRPSGV